MDSDNLFVKRLKYLKYSLLHALWTSLHREVQASPVLCINIIYESGPMDIKMPFNYSTTQLKTHLIPTFRG